jgi:outer membrane protein TolC
VRGLSAGPALSWNIFDHGRIANNVRLQDARLQVAIESFQQRALQAAQEVDNAAIAVAKSQELRAVLSESVRAAKRSLQIANTLYREGYAEFNRVLDAQRALFAQSEQQLVNEANHLSAVIALYKALGGGWLESSLDDALPDDVRTALEARGRWGTLLDEPLPIDTVSSPTR